MTNLPAGEVGITIGTLDAALYNQALIEQSRISGEPKQLLLEPAEGTQANKYAREFLTEPTIESTDNDMYTNGVYTG